MFPDNFLWGAATSSHQVEGDTHNDWSEWEMSERRQRELIADGRIERYGLNNFVSGQAVDHYHRFPEDFRIAKQLGQTATRLSIEWSRIEPEEGQFDQAEIAHYQQVIRTAQENGLEPFMTLWHWPIPRWLRDRGGWQSRAAPEYFARYVDRVARALGNAVTFWITLNEPEVYATHSYLIGVWPPQRRNVISYLTVLHRLVQAHRLAYQALKAVNPRAQVGIAANTIDFDADPPTLANRCLASLADWWWNRSFTRRIATLYDFIGINHYFHHRVHSGFNRNENTHTSDLGWELYPKAMYAVLKRLQSAKLPIYITENGLADASDRQRSWFLVETLEQVGRAISEGVDVRGYFHWSLLDNFEWDKGFWPRFGLIAVDRATLKRTIRPSARVYRTICRVNGRPDSV